MTDLICKQYTADEITVLQLAGDLDLNSAPVLEQELTAADGRRPRLVVDLSKVALVDRAGLRVLVAARRGVQARGGWVRLVIPPGNALGHRVLGLTGPECLLPVHETVEQARGAGRWDPAVGCCDP